jgi:hypothetical protein
MGELNSNLGKDHRAGTTTEYSEGKGLSIESILRKAKKCLREMDPKTQKALGTLAGIVAGEIANQAYESRTPEGKEQWEKSRIMHHADAGYLLKEFTKKDPFYQGLGEGLIVSDLKDRDKCFYPIIEQSKRKKNRKG